MAAFCETDVGFEVVWLCSFIMASMSGLGARANQFAIRSSSKVFESDPATTTSSFAPGMDAIENGSPSKESGNRFVR